MHKRAIFLLFLCFCLTQTAGCVTIGSDDGGDERQAVRSAGGDDEPGLSDLIAQIAGDVFLDAEEGVIFYGFDTLAYPNEPVELVVRLQTSKLQDIEGVTVGYFDEEGRLLDTVVTDEEGFGRWSWQVPERGDYKLEGRILDVPDEDDLEWLNTSPVPIYVMARPVEARFVVIDLDHTLVDSSFFRVLLGGGKPMADSRRVSQRIAEHYDIIYLTHRPDLMTRTSKSWLRAHQYPGGPLLVSRMREALGSSGEYKLKRLSTVRDAFPRLDIGVGDKISDAVAYAENGMEVYLLPHYDREDADEIADTMEEIRRELSGYEKVNVVDRWDQVEAGIFEDEVFAVDDYLDKMRRELRRAKEDDDGDDDDDEDEEDDD